MTLLRRLDPPDWLVVGGLVLVPAGVATWSLSAGVITLGLESLLVGLLFGLARRPR